MRRYKGGVGRKDVQEGGTCGAVMVVWTLGKIGWKEPAGFFVELLGIISAFEQKKKLEIQIHVQVVSILGNGDTHSLSLGIGEKR